MCIRDRVYAAFPGLFGKKDYFVCLIEILGYTNENSEGETNLQKKIAGKLATCLLYTSTGIIRIDTAVFCKILYGNIFLIMLFCIIKMCIRDRKAVEALK